MSPKRPTKKVVAKAKPAKAPAAKTMAQKVAAGEAKVRALIDRAIAEAEGEMKALLQALRRFLF